MLTLYEHPFALYCKKVLIADVLQRTAGGVLADGRIVVVGQILERVVMPWIERTLNAPVQK